MNSAPQITRAEIRNAIRQELEVAGIRPGMQARNISYTAPLVKTTNGERSEGNDLLSQLRAELDSIMQNLSSQLRGELNSILQRQMQSTENAIRWVLTTEMPATVFDWNRYDFVEEVLLMEGIMIPENGQVPLLDSHSRWSVDDVLGSVRDFQHLEAGGYPAIDGLVSYCADEKSQRTRQKVLDGHLTDGSVGYAVTKSVWIPDGEEAAVKNQIFTGPLKVSYEWHLKEFSNTPIGADKLAKVRSLCDAGGCRLVNI